MARGVSLLRGPEGVWVLISFLAYIAAVWNRGATPVGNEFLETLWMVIPLAGIPLTFLTAYLPGGGAGAGRPLTAWRARSRCVV